VKWVYKQSRGSWQEVLPCSLILNGVTIYF